MPKTPSDPSSRDLIQYHMFDLSIYDGLRCNFQISSTLWDTAASFMAVACIFQNIHTIFHTHHSCKNCLLYATSKPQKNSLNESQRALSRCWEYIMHVKQLLWWSHYWFFTLPLYILFSQSLGCHWKTQPVSFSHITQTINQVIDLCLITQVFLFHPSLFYTSPTGPPKSLLHTVLKGLFLEES